MFMDDIYNLLTKYADRHPEVLEIGSEVMRDNLAYDEAVMLISDILDILVP